MKAAHSNEARVAMKQTEETERAGGCEGGEERWIVVFVGQCVTAAAAEEEKDKQEEEEEPRREASPCVFHHDWFHWSP